MNLTLLLQLLLGAAEEIIPIFIHNPQSQKVEAVVFSTANAVVNSISATPQSANTATVTVKAGS